MAGGLFKLTFWIGAVAFCLSAYAAALHLAHIAVQAIGGWR